MNDGGNLFDTYNVHPYILVNSDNKITCLAVVTPVSRCTVHILGRYARFVSILRSRPNMEVAMIFGRRVLNIY